MKEVTTQIRLLVAEKLLLWALSVAPIGSNLSKGLSLFLKNHFERELKNIDNGE